jgi:hypothetical protein
VVQTKLKIIFFNMVVPKAGNGIEHREKERGGL